MSSSHGETHVAVRPSCPTTTHRVSSTPCLIGGQDPTLTFYVGLSDCLLSDQSFYQNPMLFTLWAEHVDSEHANALRRILRLKGTQIGFHSFHQKRSLQRALYYSYYYLGAFQLILPPLFALVPCWVITNLISAFILIFLPSKFASIFIVRLWSSRRTHAKIIRLAGIFWSYSQ